MKILKNKIAISSIIISTLLLIVLFITNPFIFMSVSKLMTSYQTQTILFRHKTDKFLRIEYQMQDIGAFGYNKRTVKVKDWIIFTTTEPINIKSIDTNTWEKVNEYINEVGLKGG